MFAILLYVLELPLNVSFYKYWFFICKTTHLFKGFEKLPLQGLFEFSLCQGPYLNLKYVYCQRVCVLPSFVLYIYFFSNFNLFFIQEALFFASAITQSSVISRIFSYSPDLMLESVLSFPL